MTIPALRPPLRVRRLLNPRCRIEEISMEGILSMKKGHAASVLLSALLVLAGCSLAPTYAVPPV
jgi:hypothetical protein